MILPMKMGTGKEKIGDPQRESPRARVLRWLEDAIKSGRLPRGAELPTEREIAKIVGVATCTAAMAMDEAEARGLVIRRRPPSRRLPPAPAVGPRHGPARPRRRGARRRLA